MSDQSYPVLLVAAVGLSTNIPQFEVGVMAYDADTKTFRVGDDTTTPVKLLGDKSAGFFDFPNVREAKFRKLTLYDNGTVDGVDVSELNKTNGFVARFGDNKWQNLSLSNGDGYIQILYPDGVDPDDLEGAVAKNPVINASPKLVELLDRAAKIPQFSYGETPPADGNPGDFFYSTIDELLYMRVQDASTNSFWMDIASVSGGGGSGPANRTWVGPSTPVNAIIGDNYLDSTDGYRRYLFDRDDAGVFWREVYLS